MATNDRERQETFLDNFRRFFMRGLAAVLPTLVTIAILVWAYHLIDRYIGRYISDGFIALLSTTAGAPTAEFVRPVEDALKYGKRIPEWDDSRGVWLTEEYKVLQYKARHKIFDRERAEILWRLGFDKYLFHLVAFLIAIVLVYFVGFFLASFLGRTVWRGLEQLLSRVPLIKAVYPYVKQVTDFVFGERKLEFTLVVAVQYPRKGIWSVGLMTGPPLAPLQDVVPVELVTVFVPSSPTPFTGYVITVPREDVVELPFSIEQALRFTVSGGVIRPGQAVIPEAAAVDAVRGRFRSATSEETGRLGSSAESPPG